MDKTQLRNKQAYGLLVLVALISASGVIIARGVAGTIPPITQALVRVGLGSIFLFPFAWPEIRKSPLPTRSDWMLFALMGFLGITVCYVTFLWGIQYTSATNASIIFATIPAVTNLLLALFWRKQPPLYQVAGMVLSFVGLLLVVAQGSWHNLMSLRFSAGDALLIINIVLYPLYTILGQGVMERYPPLVTGFYSSVFGTLFLLPLGTWQGIAGSWQVSWIVWLAVLYCGAFVNGLVLALNLSGIQRIGSGQAAIFGNLQPVFIFFLAVMALEERLLFYHWAGFGLVLAGVLISVWPRPALNTSSFKNGTKLREN